MTTPASSASDRPLRLSEAEFRLLAAKVSNWGRWGEDDQRGTLNFITPESITAATTLARRGLTVHCGAPTPILQPGAEHDPACGLCLTNFAMDGWQAVNDRLTIDLHGTIGLTHLDALGHVAYQGLGYNGRKIADNLSGSRLRCDAIESAREGIVGRGVLIDLPMAMEKEWMEAHECASAEVVKRAFEQTRLKLRRGDILFFRTGAFARQAATGLTFTLADAPGISIASAEWVHATEASLLITDVGLDPAPSEVENVVIPWHVLTLSRMGLRLVDCAELELLAATCRKLQQWEFLCVIAPLDLTGATSSPVNPLCFF